MDTELLPSVEQPQELDYGDYIYISFIPKYVECSTITTKCLISAIWHKSPIIKILINSTNEGKSYTVDSLFIFIFMYFMYILNKT